MKMLYVVIVETGEYSDRCDWVGGVFDNKEAAQRMVVEKSAAAREHRQAADAWSRRYQEEFYKRGISKYSVNYTLFGTLFGTPSIEQLTYDAAVRQLRDDLGPEPEGESGDRFYLVEVPLNQWGAFYFVGGDNVDA